MRRVFTVVLLLASLDAASAQQTLPRTLALGQPLSALEPLFAEDCERTETTHYTGEAAAPFTRQTQVDCHGLMVLGARRKVEFMFNDGPLGHAWILLAENEDPSRVEQALTEAFGPVVFSTDLDRVFASGTVALRSSPAEVLVATPDLVADITGYRKQ